MIDIIQVEHVCKLFRKKIKNQDKITFIYYSREKNLN